jgi:hypothetical protein
VTTFPDIEAECRQMLLGPAGVHVGTKVPDPRPASFVRLWVTGGSADQRILDRPTVTVQAWGGDTVEAAELARKCRDVFLTRFGARNEMTRPYFDPDPGTNTPRYSFTFRTRSRAQD